MASKKCEKCGAVQFFDEENKEQCPKHCAHCGNVINADFKESLDEEEEEDEEEDDEAEEDEEGGFLIEEKDTK